jgi:hypothetical protein
VGKLIDTLLQTYSYTYKYINVQKSIVLFCEEIGRRKKILSKTLTQSLINNLKAFKSLLKNCRCKPSGGPKLAQLTYTAG